MPKLKLVSNSNDNNHLAELKDLFQLKANRLLIVSPFITPNLKELLDEFVFDNVESVELVTTLKPKDPEQLSKPGILKDYFDYFSEKQPKIKVKLHVDNQLHGKIYVSTYDENHLAILGSANFTRNGLRNNHEWGVLIEDYSVIDNLIGDIFDSIEYQDITYNQIKKACLLAKHYESKNPDWKKKPEIFSDILETVYTVDDTANIEPQYFLKPIGHSESPVLLEDQEDFSD